eukprot:TRINITY_DN18673_c0_g1_i2.p1 TRINITY_DN18673_c0_g1~~TRINITY_DN18673_c0_g1_i2.p1  ORF type:complete len:394 (+),score=123.20 TRINITY_DN18673_c0_g1_i2:65-1183(+)
MGDLPPPRVASLRRQSLRRRSRRRSSRAADDDICHQALLQLPPVFQRRRGLNRASPQGSAETETASGCGAHDTPPSRAVTDVPMDICGASVDFGVSTSMAPEHSEPLPAPAKLPAPAEPPPPRPKEPGGPDAEAGYLLCALAAHEGGTDTEGHPAAGAPPVLSVVVTDCGDELFEAELDYPRLHSLREEHQKQASEQASADPTLWDWKAWLEHIVELISAVHTCTVTWPPLPEGCVAVCPREGCYETFATEGALRDHLAAPRHAPPTSPDEVTAARRLKEAVTVTLTDSSVQYAGREGGADQALHIELQRTTGVPPWQIRQWVAASQAAGPATHRRGGPAPGEPAVSPRVRRWRELQESDAVVMSRPWKVAR